ncbi:MAG: hypothetical protein H6Q44_1505, partial [Deltaproteobacteria bacterium]|nr:hypothetical protein [Deltaproteobacteria bacterium]
GLIFLGIVIVMQRARKKKEVADRA